MLLKYKNLESNTAVYIYTRIMVFVLHAYFKTNNAKCEINWITGSPRENSWRESLAVQYITNRRYDQRLLLEEVSLKLNFFKELNIETFLQKLQICSS